jgi:hypothetical protein
MPRVQLVATLDQIHASFVKADLVDQARLWEEAMLSVGRSLDHGFIEAFEALVLVSKVANW